SQTKSDYVGARSKSSFCVHQIFEFEAERLPNTVAVVFDGEEITYRELNEQANRLAHFLKKNGVNQETLVGIYMERSLGLIVALLGVLKAGGAYLPLDPMYPQERLAFMLDDSGAQVVLTHGFLAKNLSPCRAQVVCLDSVQDTINREDNGNPLPVATPNNLVYAIYTSGSTGQAKGVMVEHRSLANAYLFWDETYQLHTLKSHLQMASFSFDVFTGDLVRALCSGGKLVLCPREYLMDPPNLYRLMRREKVDFAEFVPAVLRELVSYLHKDGSKLDFLKILVCGSDSWNMDEYRRFKEVCGPNTRLINSYGVTEATIDSTYFEGTSKDFSCDVLVPIGRPFANIELYVLDSNLQPTPIGVPGELHIGGVGLARGYLNRPELTAEKFITNPFGDRPKQRLYKTGDLARYLPDANIELLGRVDFQVKIRGFRVETGEIESVLGQHPGVEQIAVAALDDALGNKRLVGYVVVKDSQSAPSMNDLRSFLKKKLPEYMVPSTFLLMDKLPLTPNGKIDRRALPTPDSLDSELEVSYVAPRSETEKKLGAIWQEVLNRDKVGVHHDFFELGGHSLLATRVMSRINQLFGIQLALRKLFEVTTIASLADLVDTLLWTGKQTFGTLPPEEREIIEM
ncbi:MAG TPA: amino acid adenylation domain-containing protein, partial [Thermodesulfobacteriota bacterium]|nr:amino acid adenylation domain-containing protein [Thermodesulfobacteriota bacterium]